MGKLFVITLVLFFAGFLKLHAQNERITIDMNSADFDVFASFLEKNSRYTLYYNKADTDTLKVTVAAGNYTLREVLEKALSPLNLFFAIDSKQSRVFITSQSPILTEFLFDDEQPATSDLALEDFKNREKNIDISIENKLFEIGNKNAPEKGKKTLSGYIKNKETGASVAMGNVSVLGKAGNIPTDQYGYYSIVIPEERSTVVFTSVGQQETFRQVIMYGSGRLDVEMENQVFTLNEISVFGERGSTVNRTQLGLEKLNLKTIKQTPTILGEADVINVILTLPGVQTAGEAANGFNVRGGATDQNMVRFGDATIFNSSHFFGLFSAFNADAVSGVELYKSSIPAKYGGRISSVLDVTTKQGNKNKFSGSGGIGPLTGRLSLEGPIGKNTSYIVGGRSTYSDWLMNFIPDETYKNSDASFYDAHLILDHQLNEKNDLYFTGYLSNDRFVLDQETHYGYGNKNLNVKWKSILKSNLYVVSTAGTDNYNFSLINNKNPADSYKLDYNLGQEFLRVDFSHRLSQSHNLSYGLNVLRYRINPGEMRPYHGESSVVDKMLEKEQALESAVYLSDTYTVTDKLTVDAGVRFSLYNYLGPRSVDKYIDGLTRSESTYLETVSYGKGENIKNYASPEIRLGLRYNLSENSSIKAGYNSLRQFIHMLSNTTSITPTDSWKLSDTYIKPQYGDQVSIGYYKNFPKRKVETSVELYYKRISDYLDYKSGAVLIMNEAIERDVLSTEARAYGAEFQVKKVTGKLNGWASYTYSRIEQRTTSEIPGESINGGRYYPGNYDKPHNFTTVANYRFSHRFSFSANSTYSTGRPITLPVGEYTYAGSKRVYYSDRNQYRIPDFFRIDVSMNIEGNHKIKKLAHSSWSIGVYNLLGRKNPFSVYFVAEEGVLNGYKLSIFGNPIPFLTYNFKF